MSDVRTVNQLTAPELASRAGLDLETVSREVFDTELPILLDDPATFIAHALADGQVATEADDAAAMLNAVTRLRLAEFVAGLLHLAA